MKIILPAVLASAIFAAPALSETATRTTTIDTPKVSGTRTQTVDHATHTRTNDVALTRKSDGATADRHVTRVLSGNDATITGNSTSFNGTKRVFQRTVTRPEGVSGRQPDRQRNPGRRR